MEINEKQQELIYKFNLFQQQIQQIQEQVQMIEKGINDLNELEKGIKEIKGKKDMEILSHIGKGIFIRTKIISEDLIVDIGKKNFVKKNTEDTREMIKKQIERLVEMKENLDSSLEEVNSEMAKVIEDIQRN